MNAFRYPLITVGLALLLTQTAQADKPPSKGTIKISAPSGKVAGAKLTLDEARKIALENAKGEIVSEKLDKLADSVCYSFDVKVDDAVKEVLVDGTTGQVVIVEKGPAAPSATPHIKLPTLRPH